MSTSMNILVAIDDSTFSDAAITSVIERTWPEGSKFKLLSVVEPFHPEYAGWHTNYMPVAVEAQKELVEAAKTLVNEKVKQLTEAFGRQSVLAEVREGYVTDTILEAAKEWPADLIVVGSHGRTGITRLLLGSVSEAVVSQAPCSVEIVKMPKKHAKA
ncbi:MAG TPA: universal stress protein [Candidatus Melainabacteria bacterium]|jgi:nucleotide-binding universal stress UspA family protein|nr:universal stress protein [Candidatus Melainabacteria bacterium]